MPGFGVGAASSEGDVGDGPNSGATPVRVSVM